MAADLLEAARPPTLRFSKLPAPRDLRVRGARVGQKIMVGEKEYVVGQQRAGDKVWLRARKLSGSEVRRRRRAQQEAEARLALAELGIPEAPAPGRMSKEARRALLSLMSEAGLARRLQELKKSAAKKAPAAQPVSDVVLSPGCVSFVLKASCRKRLCGGAPSKSKSRSKSRSRTGLHQ